ncbi:MAG: DUF4153 domain-containing protein [Ginsengibacter sp.]
MKIYFTKTTYYLLRLNTWAAIILLVFATIVNWDEMIAEYNLERKSAIPLDVPFLLSLSDKTLPLLEKNKDVLEKDSSSGDRYYINNGFYNAIDFFEYRKKNFLDQQRNYTWLSWNVVDATVKKELDHEIHFSSLKK